MLGELQQNVGLENTLVFCSAYKEEMLLNKVSSLGNWESVGFFPGISLIFKCISGLESNFETPCPMRSIISFCL